jgi:membrane associated rhomboid family serine protease
MPVAALMGATLFVTAIGSLVDRTIRPVFTYLVLDPHKVFDGQLWRLPAWVLVEPSGLSLIFGLLLLFFIAPEVLYRWGTRRFFLAYFGGTAVIGAVTCLIGWLFWTDVYDSSYVGMWPTLAALIIAWAGLFPDRVIRVYFVLPLSGRHLIAFEIAATIVMGFVDGFVYYAPHYVAEVVALVYMDVFSFRRLYLRGRMAMLQRDYKKRTTNLRAVDDRDRDEPPRWTH